MSRNSRRQQVHDFFRDRIETTGAAPTYREAGDAARMSAVAAWKHVQALVAEGKLVRRGRTIDLPGRADLSGVGTEQLRAELARRGVTLDALEQPKVPMDEGRPCAANGCSNRVRRGHLMCRDHWMALPGGYRDDIFRAFRARQAQAYQTAVEAARDYLGGFTRVVERAQ
jgi:hypothetical protein